MTCCGRRHHIVADIQGPRLIVEVDGVPHVISSDGGGQVRAPAPAFVVRVPVARGDTVRAGDPLVVMETMKMETAITAPFAGTIHEVIRQRQYAGGGRGAAGSAAAIGPAGRTYRGRAAPGSGRTGQSSGPRGNGGPASLRSYLLGYDLDEAAARQLSRRQEAMLDAASHADPDLLRHELDLLEIFADITALAGREPDESEDDEHSRSAENYLFTYLATLDPDRSGLPEQFLRQLRHALTRYGITSLRRTPELELALLHMYRSLGRISVVAPAVMAILDRWLRRRDVLMALMTDERLAVLDRLIASTERRHQEVCDLAREVRFSYIDAPLLNQTRAQIYAGDGELSRRAGRPPVRAAHPRNHRPPGVVPAADAGAVAGQVPGRGHHDQDAAPAGPDPPLLPHPRAARPAVRGVRQAPGLPGQLHRGRPRHPAGRRLRVRC